MLRKSTVMAEWPSARSLAIGASTVAAGQAVLALFVSQSRAGSANVRRDGLAFLAPDSLVYLEASESIVDVMQVPWNRWLYVALLHAGDRFGDASFTIVVLQLLLASLAAASLHHMVKSIGGDRAGVLAAAAFAMNPLTAQWFRFLLTETLFYALILLALYFAASIHRNGPRAGSLTAGMMIAVLASLTRPNGILVAAGIMTVIAIKAAPQTRSVVRTVSVTLVWTGAVIGLLLGVAATGGPAERSFTTQLFNGIVVEGDDRVVVRVDMPPALDESDESVSAAVRYVADEPGPVLKLFAVRIITESIQVRPHYPVWLNLAVGGLMAVYFSMSIVGRGRARSAGLTRVILTLGLPLALLVGATFAVPEGRYGWSYLILLAPIVGLGMDATLRAATLSLGRDQSRPGPGTAR